MRSLKPGGSPSGLAVAATDRRSQLERVAGRVLDAPKHHVQPVARRLDVLRPVRRPRVQVRYSAEEAGHEAGDLVLAQLTEADRVREQHRADLVPGASRGAQHGRRRGRGRGRDSSCGGRQRCVCRRACTVAERREIDVLDGETEVAPHEGDRGGAARAAGRRWIPDGERADLGTEKLAAEPPHASQHEVCVLERRGAVVGVVVARDRHARGGRQHAVETLGPRAAGRLDADAAKRGCGERQHDVRLRAELARQLEAQDVGARRGRAVHSERSERRESLGEHCAHSRLQRRREPRHRTVGVVHPVACVHKHRRERQHRPDPAPVAGNVCGEQFRLLPC
jgi:hypothetical protein